MTTHAAALGAPVTDIEDFVSGSPRPVCRPGGVPESDPQPPPADGGRLVRWVVVPGLLVAVAAAWIVGRSTAGPLPTVPDAPTAPAGLTGFAELYVATYLTAAGPDTVDVLAPFVATTGDIDALVPYARYVPRAAAIGVGPIGDEYWTVVVAAEVLYRIEGGYGPGSLEYYEIAVATSDGGFAATAAPMPIPAPRAPVPHATYGELRGGADEATTSFVTEFLGAYFGGSGRLPRLVTVESGISPVTPAPATTIEVRSIAVGEIDGQRWVTTTAVLTDADGVTLPTSVTLRLVGDASGVRVAELLPGPPPVTTGSG